MTDDPTTTNFLPPLDAGTDHVFRAMPIPSGGRRVFGGEMAAQAVRAAERVLDGFALHAISAQFLRAGVLDLPIAYHVEILSTGRRFARTEVRCLQDGRLLNVMALSMAAGPPEDDRQSDRLPVPETAPLDPAWLARERPDLNRINGLADSIDKTLTELSPDGRTLGFWFRPVRGRPGASELLAYASDRHVMTSAQLTTALASGLGAASGLGQITLNNDLRIHRAVDRARPLFQRIRTEVWGVGRTFATGVILDAEGTRLASFAQEGLIG